VSKRRGAEEFGVKNDKGYVRSFNWKVSKKVTTRKT